LYDKVKPSFYKKHLKRGEYAIPVDGPQELNCFCLDCGINWHEDLHLQFFTPEQIDEQKKLRGISDDKLDKNIDNYFKPNTNTKKTNKHKKTLGTVKTFLGF
jgi:hypothetical protein